MSEPFRVLHVCTGNVGRSPIAERLMRLRVNQVLGSGFAAVEVTSAGTWGCEGAGMEEFAAVALAERGGDPQGFVARELTNQILDHVDLVLTATLEHRSQVVSRRPQVVRQTFTLKEFARLTGAVAPVSPTPAQSELRDRAVDMVDQVGRARGIAGHVVAPDDDVADPIGAPLETYRQRAAEIDEACQRAVGLLARLAH